MAAAHLDLDLDHAHPPTARHDDLVQDRMNLHRSVCALQRDLEPQPLLDLVVAGQHLVQGPLEVDPFDLGEEANAAQVDAQRRHAGGVDCPRRAQEGAVAAEDADDARPRQVRADGIGLFRRRLPGIDAVLAAPRVPALEQAGRCRDRRVVGEADGIGHSVGAPASSRSMIFSSCRRSAASSTATSGSCTAAYDRSSPAAMNARIRLDGETPRARAAVSTRSRSWSGMRSETMWRIVSGEASCSTSTVTASSPTKALSCSTGVTLRDRDDRRFMCGDRSTSCYAPSASRRRSSARNSTLPSPPVTGEGMVCSSSNPASGAYRARSSSTR